MKIELKSLIVPVLACLVACSSDGTSSEPDVADVGSGDAIETGPSDDAGRVDVEVPAPTAPRAFRLSLGVPVDALDEEFGQQSWDYATANSDVLTVRLNNGLPWAEILADGAALPAEYEAFLADLADRVGRSERDLLLIVDPFDADRVGLAADVLGRPPVSNGLSFADRTLQDGYEAFCEALAQRFQPKYFVPFPDLNVYGANNAEQFDALRVHYEELRQTVKFASGQTLVFATWNFNQLRQAIRSGNETQLAWISELDEALDFFAIDYRPSLVGTTAADLSGAPFVDVDRRQIDSVTTRRLVIVDAGYPAAGVNQSGEVFPSSENSQFNYLAFALALGDELDIEMLVWTVAVDPDRWLLDLCGEGVEDCDVAPFEERYGELRQHGIVDSDGGFRAATSLWEQYAERTWVP